MPFRPMSLVARAAALLLALTIPLSARAGDAHGGLRPAAAGLSLEEADRLLSVAERMLQGGIYDRVLEIADSILDNPDASGTEPGDGQAWLRRREKARFLRERGRFGLAASGDDFEDVAGAFLQLSNNRYRLSEPVYAVQSAYWAARAFEEIAEYRDAADNYSRVGGVALPPEMEGDAARRMSRCLRRLAEEIPFPGTLNEQGHRERLLNQAIAELDRARLAFPVGNRRKEIELDLIALRMARREEKFTREAATEAEAYIAGDPAKDRLRARAVLYRGQAAAMLGDSEGAAEWFRRVVEEEAPDDEDRRAARLGLALALLERSSRADTKDRPDIYRRAAQALEEAVAGSVSPGPWDGARIIKARVRLELNQPTAALEALSPILTGDTVNPAAWETAGLAELRRGGLKKALEYLYPPTRPSTPRAALRHSASREASRTATRRRNYGLALALNHQASRMLRRERLYSSLLVSEFRAMEILLGMGKMDGPLSLSGDMDLFSATNDTPAGSAGEMRRTAAERLGRTLGRILWSGGNPDSGYDAGLAAEAAQAWTHSGPERLELAVAMIQHLRKRRPEGIDEATLHSRLGEARHALALARAERILEADAPDEKAIDSALGDFAAAAASFLAASSGAQSVQDNLEQGMVNMESGAFLMRLAEKWDRGRWAALSQGWRDEARQRVEASLRPFNLAIATSGPSSQAARRAKWSRGRALELVQEWRGAAADYLSLMNNSELPRVLRTNAARRWAECMGMMGESGAALARLAAFAEIDAESALLAGRLAEEAGNLREAHQYYLFAAEPESPALPPATPDRTQHAAFGAARLALRSPGEANPLQPPAATIDQARRLLENSARANLSGTRVVPMLTLLGENLMGDPDGWRAARALATDIAENRNAPPAVQRAMLVLSAKARAGGEDYGGALDDLDMARELLDGSTASGRDEAMITLESARVYRSQGRGDDALRAYADVFAVHPEQTDLSDAARREAAVMLLSHPDAGPREREQARNILSGLGDQQTAERIMREHGVR